MRKQLQNVAEVFCSKSDDGLDIKLKIVGGNGGKQSLFFPYAALIQFHMRGCLLNNNCCR